MPAFAALLVLEFQPETRVFASSSNKQGFEDEDEKDDEKDCLPPVSGQT